MDEVVAEGERAGFAREPVAGDEEGLRDPIGLGLFGEGELDSEARAVPEQPLELRQIVRGGDDHDVADAGQHER
jgi:hypothetical protein